MTCIVAITDGTTVTMGADTLGVGGSYDCVTRTDEKVFINGDFLIGFTSSFRMGQILRYAWTPPQRSRDESDTMRFMVSKVVPSWIEALRAGHFSRNKDGEERGGVFLVGYEGQLFEIDSDYQVGVNACGYAAAGCGANYALGALHATEAGYEDEPRIRLALEAAEEFSAGVRGPFKVLRK